ncbi:3-hydroxyacyl-ACP dehydratase FabZ [Thermodesulfobacteriota bacterium]
MDQRTDGNVIVGIDEIMRILPHRYPFLLVDRIVELDAGKRIVGIKNVTINEPFFQGHLPENPVMPGVLLIEALAQVGAILVLKTLSEVNGSFIYLAGLDRVRFRRPVVPGDQARLEAVIMKKRNQAFKVRARALVDGEKVVEADLLAMIK